MAYIPEQSFNYGGPTGTLASVRNLPIDQLLSMRTNARIAQAAPALTENARQFDVGTGENARQFDVGTGENARQFNVSDVYRNRALTSEEARAAQALGENARQFNVGDTGTNQRYYTGLAENARQANQNVGVDYAQMANQQLLAQLQAWSSMMAGLNR